MRQGSRARPQIARGHREELMPLALSDLTDDVGKSDVTPILASHDQADARPRYPILNSDCGIRSNVFSDGENLFCSEKGVALRCALRLPALGDHVGRVVAVRPEKKMVDVDTGAIVASVTDHDPYRDRTILCFPRETVGSFLLPPIVHHAISKLNNSAPSHAPVFIGRPSVMRQSPRQRPVTGNPKLYTSGFSHGVRFLRCCDQGRVGASTPRGPNILAMAA